MWLLSMLRKEKKKIEHEGDLTVFREAIELAAARREARVSTVRPALMVLGGVLRGVYGGGGVRALERAGLTQGFSSATGVSAGVPTIAFFLASQAGVGTRLLYEECISDHFLTWRGKHFANVSYLARIWRGEIGDKRLDTFALVNNPTHAYAAVVPVTSNITEFVDMAELRDPVEAIVAAASMPGLYFGKPNIQGTEMVDGAMTDPFPVERFAALTDPTSLLVFANRPRGEEDNPWLLFLYDVYVKYVCGRRAHIFTWEKNARRRAAYAWLAASGIPYCIVYTDDLIGSFTRNKEGLMAAADRFEAYITNLIGRAQEEKIG